MSASTGLLIMLIGIVLILIAFLIGLGIPRIRQTKSTFTPKVNKSRFLTGEVRFGEREWKRPRT